MILYKYNVMLCDEIPIIKSVAILFSLGDRIEMRTIVQLNHL